MAHHEFGIMEKDPKDKERFDAYNPQKYSCIVLDDSLIEPVLADLTAVDCYWHTLQMPKKGLAYFGITLIPPKSLDSLIGILYSLNKTDYTPLISLANQAKKHCKYIIHFGI